MASYLQTVLADGPVSYWRLGESVGPTAVDSVGANTGTYINGPTLGIAGPLLPGDTNTAASFDRPSSQYVDIADNNTLDFGDGPFSYELFFRFTNTATQTFIGKGTNALMIQANRLVSGQIEANVKGSGINATASGTWHNGQYHHLVATHLTGITKLYIDGNDVTVAGFQNNAASTATNLNIGRDTGVGNAMFGELDEVAVYNKVLTAGQVAAHYAARANPTDFGGNRHGLLKRLDPIAEDDDIYYLLGIL